MSYEFLDVQLEHGIVTITFNRPKALNALNSGTLHEFADAIAGIGRDEEIRVLKLVTFE